jgi:hypothetical protein
MTSTHRIESRISRSKKLRKYATAYKSYIRKSEQSKIVKSPRVERTTSCRARRHKSSTKHADSHRSSTSRGAILTSSGATSRKVSKKRKSGSEVRDKKIRTEKIRTEKIRTEKIRTEKIRTEKICTTKSIKSLNAYQRFVQKESKNSKYADIPGNQRLRKIAEEWKKQKKF